MENTSSEETVNAALGKPNEVTIADQKLLLEPLNLGDIGDIDQEFGGMENLDASQFRHRLFLFWLWYRKTDERLTEEQRRYGQYLITLDEMRRRTDIPVLQIDAVALHLLFSSEVINGGKQAESPQGNAPAEMTSL